VRSLRERLGTASDCSGRFFWGIAATIAVSDLVGGSSLNGRLQDLFGKSVLLATEDPLATALALIEVDGVARRMVIAPPGLSSEHLRSIVADAGIEAIVSDLDPGRFRELGVGSHVACEPRISEAARSPLSGPTEWVLLTSGTTGPPKLLSYSLEALIGAIDASAQAETPPVWATFFDLRRFGGLQIFFRAVLSNGSLVLSGRDTSIGEFLAHLANHKATHIHATPSHWRRVLLNPLAGQIKPKYIRLSGEVADQSILDSLHSFCPQAAIVHAYASTEAGVVFEVADCLEGFPVEFIDNPGAVDLKIENGSLRIRSRRTASGYVANPGTQLKDQQGFVDSGDIVERRGVRYYFLGRKSGIINVGGLKVHPEEVEAIINSHPAVRMSFVHGRRNPMTGSIVVANVVLAADAERFDTPEEIRQQILQSCRAKLTPYKVPATVRFVATLDVSPSGKLVRHDA
jgi:acyl-coenzyme A synthetase/AMP-(fatty) acid ligase